ncbi:MAG: undecaprenyl phosphate translocase family protein [Anaeroplasma sp.]
MTYECTTKNNIIVLLKGILLGLISMGIPGLSASTIAIILGIYLLMVNSIANIFKDFKKNIIFLLFLILGYGIGAILAAFSVDLLFKHFPLATTLVILGLILGSIPEMFYKSRKDIKKISCWIVFSIIFATIICYNLLISKSTETEFPNDPDLGYLISIAIIGLITSSTFIIPGVDFAVVFLSLGLYYPFLNMITELLSFFSPNYFDTFLPNIKILGFYLAGYFTGMFLFSKLIKFLTAKYSSQTSFASIAFVTAAPIIVINNCIIQNDSFRSTIPQWIVGIILAIVAGSLMIFISIYNYKKNKQNTNSTVN